MLGKYDEKFIYLNLGLVQTTYTINSIPEISVTLLSNTEIDNT